MLVVMGIIALLAGVLLPVTVGARRRARQTKCASNLRQLSLAYSAYEIDYPDGFYTLGLTDSGVAGWTGDSDEERQCFVGDWSALWPGQLERHLRTVNVYECPAADVRYVNAFHPPHLRQPLPLGYAWNAVVWQPNLTREQMTAERRKLIKGHEADHMLFVDKTFYKCFYISNHLMIAGFANVPHIWLRYGYCPDNRDRRHPPGSNVLFCDGHVEALSFEEIWRRFNYEGRPKPPNGYVLR
jgi:prepilin-type processing-associated H-X9-DG protein